LRIKLERAGVVLEPRRIVRFVTASDGALSSVETEDGGSLPRDAMIVRPPQRQVPLIHALALELDPQGFVRVDGNGETSAPGIYAAGDLTTHMQAAIFAAAAGTRAAYLLNYAMNMEKAAAT
jgi:thioredoxin reductase